MPTLEPDMLILISGWVLVSAAVGLMFGFVIGRWYTLSNEPKKLKSERDRTMGALQTVLSSAGKLNEDVEGHSDALAVVLGHISRIDTSGDEVTLLQRKLLKCVTRMVESNRKLEHELVVARYQLEEQAEVLDATKKEARTDPLLFELGNRKAFDEAIRYGISHYQTGGKSCALLLVDADHFKAINDTFGHSVGDRVLVSIGQSLMNCVRPNDQVFRIGGDEFGILLYDVSPDSLKAVGKRIRSEVELCEFHVDIGSESAVVTLSMGLAVVEQKDTPESFFVRADNALYHSKEQGRNRLTTKVANKTEEFKVESNDVVDKPTFTSYERFKALANSSE